MREAQFLKKNKERWLRLEEVIKGIKRVHPDTLSDMFIELTDDLSYARTFYPNSKTTKYLNNLSFLAHQNLYRNKKTSKGRFKTFWKYELPLLVRSKHKTLLFSLVIFSIACFIGWVSAAYDETFVRLILGDYYVDMTLENIKEGKPMDVYASQEELGMFLGITYNNIMVAFRAFAAGIVLSFGTGLILFFNGIMLGCFQYFFYQKGLLITSALSIWVHGTLEISAIIIAGGAGFVLGNSILFPGTYSRMASLKAGAMDGLKIVVGLVPIFITAGFLEGFVTRHSPNLPVAVSSSIIFVSLAFIIWYFIIYPIQLSKKIQHADV